MATPNDLLTAVQWSDCCKEADELTTVCGEVVKGDTDLTQVKCDSSDPFTRASACSVAISSVLPDATGTHAERIQEINSFLKTSVVTWVPVYARHMHVDSFGVPIRTDRNEQPCCEMHYLYPGAPDIERLSISCRPHYLLSKFGQIFVGLYQSCRHYPPTHART